ncbi:hypothetical protein BDN67DRAFT_990750 [Paxillus ammoniavirescens]|nr:hypothetical protein BDN67DRAFT_990750 [Paxillus ammoniavirescens]
MADPSLERRPDFSGEAYRTICDALTQAVNENDQQVTDRLAAAWDTDKIIRVEAWNQQQAIEAQVQAEAERAWIEQEAEALLAEEEVERERKEAEKKKQKMNNFDETSSVPSVIKLSAFDFVDLWYFSPAGCAEATRNNQANADDTFGISKVDEILTLRSVTSVKASRNTVEDHELTFEVFLQAKNNFLFYAKNALWPPKHLDALAEFFWNIETHPMRSNPNGNAVVLTYALRVQHNWHDDLKANQAFNISIINKELMKNIVWEVNTWIGEERTCRVSHPLPSL